MEANNTKRSNLVYIREFDALRAIAAIFVIISHVPGLFWNNRFIYGGTGVGFFFVLSGFLITRILLHEKYEQVLSNRTLLKRFYTRRALRIFPAYYAFLLLNFLLSNPEIREHTWYYLLYGSNILFFQKADFGGSLSPTWSLAVEEQFYLLWPIIFCLIPKKKFLKITGILLLGSIVFRLGFVFACKKDGVNASLEGVLLHANIHFLMSGALLAYLNTYDSSFANRFAKTIYVVVAGIVLIVLAVLSYNFWSLFIFKLFLAFFSVLLLNKVYWQSVKKEPNFLHNPLLRYIGRISYGTYLYHTVAVSVLMHLLFHFFNFNAALPSNAYVSFFITLVVTIALASISWFILEKPINNLKKFFAY